MQREFFDLGKGFSVVADEIRDLSQGTQKSSAGIREALQLLEDTSDKMTVSKNLVLFGTMINLSAGGFAFSCKAQELADAIGEKLELHIENFEFLGEETLPGVVICSSNNDVFSVGCRMPSDHARIEEYVRKKMGL